MAVTGWFAFMVKVQGSPEQAPLQPRNPYGGSGVAVSVTEVPKGNDALQVPPPFLQLIPAGLEVTVPVPVPAKVTCTGSAKLAEIWASVLSVIEQEAFPEQALPQPKNEAPVSGVSVRVTLVPAGKLAEQVFALLPQLMPAGVLVIVPPRLS